MPVSTDYLSASIAMIRLSTVNDMLNQLPSIETNLLGSGIAPTQAKNILKTYKAGMLTYIKTQAQIAANEAVVYSLGGATESDDKNNQLTPIIAGAIVNPVGPLNAEEQAAMVAAGVEAGVQLTQLINNATQALS